MSDDCRIAFVYLDLGNVLVDFDPDAGCRNVAEWAGVSRQAVLDAVWSSGLEVEFESGRLSPRAFAEAVMRGLGSGARIDAAGQPLLDRLSDMFTPSREMVALVDEVRRAGVPLGILSNTCHAHWDWIKRQGWPVVGDWSSIDVLSYEVGAMKPDARIYTEAARLAGVEPTKIFFADDRQENVDGAVAAGWQAFRFTSPQTLRQQFVDVGVLVQRAPGEDSSSGINAPRSTR